MLHTLVWEWNCFLGEVQDEGGQQLEGESRGLRRGRRWVSMGTNSCNSRQWSREMQCGFEEGGEKRRDPHPYFSELSPPLISPTLLFHPTQMDLSSSLPPNLSLPLALRICFGTKRKLILSAVPRTLGETPLVGKTP